MYSVKRLRRQRRTLQVRKDIDLNHYISSSTNFITNKYYLLQTADLIINTKFKYFTY